MSKQNSNRISFIQFICTILVVVLHGCNLIPWDLYSTDCKHAIIFEKIIMHITYIAVPVFFFLSGYLMFKNYNYKNKVKKRLKSLVIPYVLWNFLCALFFLGVEQISFLNIKINRPKVKFNISFLKEVWLQSSFNGPLWYLRNIIIISLLSILVYYLLYYKIIGQLVIIGFCVLNLVIEFDYYGLIYWMPEYLIGAYVALHGLPGGQCFNSEELQFTYILSNKKRWLLYFSLMLLFLVSFYSFFINNFRTIFIYRLFSALLFPFIISNYAFSKKEMNWKYKVTMFIYCSHFTITTIVSKIFLILFGVSDYSAIISCILCPVITLSVLYPVMYFMIKNTKRTWNVLSGGRKVDV